jgi:hypothetical protein
MSCCVVSCYAGLNADLNLTYVPFAANQLELLKLMYSDKPSIHRLTKDVNIMGARLLKDVLPQLSRKIQHGIVGSI